MPAEPKKDAPATLSFDYVKGSGFRVLHADGAFIGAAANGVTIAFYSERQPIPRRVVHKLKPNLELGEEVVEQRIVRDAIIRDVDVDIAMSLAVAKNVHQTLGELIVKIEEVLNPKAAVEKVG